MGPLNTNNSSTGCQVISKIQIVAAVFVATLLAGELDSKEADCPAPTGSYWRRQENKCCPFHEKLISGGAMAILIE